MKYGAIPLLTAENEEGGEILSSSTQIISWFCIRLQGCYRECQIGLHNLLAVCAKMGVAASFMMGSGSPTTQVVNLITGSLYTSFIEKDTSSFPEFHEAFLDIFNAFNSALPGKHYDVPSRLEVEEVFADWKNTNGEEERKQVFVEFIKKKVGLNKPERLTLITGLVTPPASMAAKKAGESVPALSIIKAVPDVLFVPTATVLALISVKVSKNVLQKRVVQKDQQKTIDRHKTMVRQKTLKASDQQGGSV